MLRPIRVREHRLTVDGTDPETARVSFETRERYNTNIDDDLTPSKLVGEDQEDDRSDSRVTLVLIRHGQSEGNAYPGEYPWPDPPLTALGRAQAVVLGRAQLVQSWGIQRVLCSPMRRAVQTARRVFCGHDTLKLVHAIPSLTEFYPGSPENVPVGEEALREFVAREEAENALYPAVDLDRCFLRDDVDEKTAEGGDSGPELGSDADSDSDSDGIQFDRGETTPGDPSSEERPPRWWTHDFALDEQRLEDIISYACAAPERRLAVVCHYGVIQTLLELLGFSEYIHPHNCSPLEVVCERVTPAASREPSPCWVALEPRIGGANEDNALVGGLRELAEFALDLEERSAVGLDRRDHHGPAAPVMQIPVLHLPSLGRDRCAVVGACVKTFALTLAHERAKEGWRVVDCAQGHRHEDVRVALVSHISSGSLDLLRRLLAELLQDSTIDTMEGNELRWFDWSRAASRAIDQRIDSDPAFSTLLSSLSVQEPAWQKALASVQWCIKWQDHEGSHSEDI
jgi:Histidine phosphatase superfamily (branch 1)